jgi:hypothetical protein
VSPAFLMSGRWPKTLGEWLLFGFVVLAVLFFGLVRDYRKRGRGRPKLKRRESRGFEVKIKDRP